MSKTCYITFFTHGVQISNRLSLWSMAESNICSSCVRDKSITFLQDPQCWISQEFFDICFVDAEFTLIYQHRISNGKMTVLAGFTFQVEQPIFIQSVLSSFYSKLVIVYATLWGKQSHRMWNSIHVSFLLTHRPNRVSYFSRSRGIISCLHHIM